MTARVDHVLSSNGKLPSLTVAKPPSRSVPVSWQSTKRFMDVTISALALLASAPVVAAASLGIMAVSPGSPFFAQERVGKDGRRFKMYKLRTMRDGAHLLHKQMREYNEVAGPVLKIRDDPRLHGLGAMLRRTSIDELPNLINVLRGEMSLVGPRPPLPAEVEHYDDFALRRLTVRPGITCTWQIGGRSNVSFDEWMQLDNAYVDSWTPFGDFVILLRTIPAVISGDGAH